MTIEHKCDDCGDTDAHVLLGDSLSLCRVCFRVHFFWQAIDEDTDPDTFWEHMTGVKW